MTHQRRHEYHRDEAGDIVRRETVVRILEDSLEHVFSPYFWATAVAATTANFKAMIRTVPTPKSFQVDLIDESQDSFEKRVMGGFPTQFTRLAIIFQNGPVIGDCPQNGVTPNALLAVIEDHLASRQTMDSSGIENNKALNHIRAALDCLNSRIDTPFSTRSAYLGLTS